MQNVTGTFITAKAWLSNIRAVKKEGLSPAHPPGQVELRNVSLIIIGSEAGFLGACGNPDYAASKSAVQSGLMLSLAADAARLVQHARVNAICPGAVDTPQFRRECDEDSTGMVKWVESEATVPLRVPVSREHIARACLVLASDRWSGSTTGQAIRIDSGKSGRVFWNPGQWTA
jgi:NAD(P)-dependent dehydrogenase (short-subunit alcohol dehydrogenase family)